MARAMEDPSKKFIEFVDGLEVPEASNTYNITGKSAAHVIAILKSIVNREGRYGYRKGKVFIFKIENPPTISFSLRANPTDHQPGNGVISIKSQSDVYRYNQDLVDQLNGQYSSNTRKFAQDIKLVFKNNSELLKLLKDEENQIIQHVYFLLLFEIGRRLVKDGQESTPEKKDFDKLRISEAIKIFVELFENEACRFEDVFLNRGKYHCFSGKREARRIAITRLLKQAEELELKDLEELFHLEEPVSGMIGNFKELSFKE
ncbi:PREDICTED: uncharacterized protein LOC107357284 [Acropora digitifera]|uniref:uncharacterized protein LOC107357284 n=1 Tax=Acropora digitifera TaxID=70779 RepID=UPI00077A1599|nr:PREDICTED: uncharacterized protein LOC107357284 [Acropora digitifera]